MARVRLLVSCCFCYGFLMHLICILRTWTIVKSLPRGFVFRGHITVLPVYHITSSCSRSSSFYTWLTSSSRCMTISHFHCFLKGGQEHGIRDARRFFYCQPCASRDKSDKYTLKQSGVITINRFDDNILHKDVCKNPCKVKRTRERIIAEVRDMYATVHVNGGNTIRSQFVFSEFPFRSWDRAAVYQRRIVCMEDWQNAPHVTVTCEDLLRVASQYIIFRFLIRINKTVNISLD